MSQAPPSLTRGLQKGGKIARWDQSAAAQSQRLRSALPACALGSAPPHCAPARPARPQLCARTSAPQSFPPRGVRPAPGPARPPEHPLFAGHSGRLRPAAPAVGSDPSVPCSACFLEPRRVASPSCSLSCPAVSTAGCALGARRAWRVLCESPLLGGFGLCALKGTRYLQASLTG